MNAQYVLGKEIVCVTKGPKILCFSSLNQRASVLKIFKTTLLLPTVFRLTWLAVFVIVYWEIIYYIAYYTLYIISHYMWL